MQKLDRCDAVFWEVDGKLLSVLRSELSGRVRREGPKIEAEAGVWRGKRVVVARPQRAIAKQLAKLRDVVGSLVVAHHPEVVVAVGPAAAVAPGVEVGDVVLSNDLPDLGNDAYHIGGVAQGSVEANSPPEGILATTDWAENVAATLQPYGAECAILAIVTSKSSNIVVRPPRSARRTLSRDIGSLLGKLSQGSFGSDAGLARSQRAAADAAAALLGAIDKRKGPDA